CLLGKGNAGGNGRNWGGHGSLRLIRRGNGNEGRETSKDQSHERRSPFKVRASWLGAGKFLLKGCALRGISFYFYFLIFHPRVHRKRAPQTLLRHCEEPFGWPAGRPRSG